jgi:hypothetical protein
MARTRLKAGRTPEEIGNAIVAAWYAALPDATTGSIGLIDVPALTAALSNIIDSTVEVVLDEESVTHIVVPYIFDVVHTRPELAAYLHTQYDNSDRPTPEGEKNPFNPRNKKKQGPGAGSNAHARKRRFGEDLGDALFFGCGR